MCYCEVRTLQTKSTMYKQCKQNSRDFVKKILVIKLDPPKISTNRHAWPRRRWHRGRGGKGVVFTTILITWSGFNTHHGHVIAFLDKTLYNDCFCLVASDKFNGQKFAKIQRNIESLETPKQERNSPQSSHCNEKHWDRPTISVQLCPVKAG